MAVIAATPSTNFPVFSYKKNFSHENDPHKKREKFGFILKGDYVKSDSESIDTVTAIVSSIPRGASEKGTGEVLELPPSVGTTVVVKAFVRDSAGVPRLP